MKEHMEAYDIEIAADHTESQEFSNFLNRLGHTATIGSTTANRIDGESTSNSADANEIMRQLWEDFCNR